MGVSKPKIVFVNVYDWAGSGYWATRAINSAEMMQARLISMKTMNLGFPDDVVVERDGIEKAHELIEQADLVHVCNFLPTDRDLKPLRIPRKKIRSVSMTGSLYRKDIAGIDHKTQGLSLVIQNPSYRRGSRRSTFIPHALPPELFAYSRWGAKEKVVGCYDKKSKNTTNQQDIALLTELLPSDWSIGMRGKLIDWPDRVQELRKSKVYFEYLDENMAYWGRSALEACASGIPVITYWSDYAVEMSQGRLGTIPMIKATRSSLPHVLEVLRNDDQLKLIGMECRAWAKENFSYITVGNYFNQFFKEIL